MSKRNWNDKDENGEYIDFYMRHEIEDHDRTEEQAIAVLTKYFGPERPIEVKQIKKSL